MADNWQDDPAMKRAAFIGMIGNGALPAADRIAMAQQVIRELETLVADRPGSDLSEDLHSAARCGQPGPHACPGCVIDGLREELDRANTEITQLAGAKTKSEKLSRELATLRAGVRTGKSRVGDGIDRRGWTDAQWLEEARSIFYDAFGGAGDLLNGHVSAMWKQLTAAKHEQEQLVGIVAATLRQLGTVLGINIGEEIRKHVSAGPGLSGTGTLATPTEPSPAPSNVDNMQRELAILNDFLHARCMHPGYEYATTTGPRKAFDNYDLPPDKRDGWVPNTHSGNAKAWERFDYHEERYWRRPWTLTSLEEMYAAAPQWQRDAWDSLIRGTWQRDG